MTGSVTDLSARNRQKPWRRLSLVSRWPIFIPPWIWVTTRSARSASRPFRLCPGDCTNDGAVGVDELILGVNIALGNADLSECPAFDGDGGGTVDINELVSAVNAALKSCAAT